MQSARRKSRSHGPDCEGACGKVWSLEFKDGLRLQSTVLPLTSRKRRKQQAPWHCGFTSCKSGSISKRFSTGHYNAMLIDTPTCDDPNLRRDRVSGSEQRGSTFRSSERKQACLSCALAHLTAGLPTLSTSSAPAFSSFKSASRRDTFWQLAGLLHVSHLSPVAAAQLAAQTLTWKSSPLSPRRSHPAKYSGSLLTRVLLSRCPITDHLPNA